MRLCLAVVLFTFAFAPALAAGPSFDCAKATAADEKAICADARLSELDLAVNDGYKRMVTALGKDSANRIHAPYLRRRHACGAKADCIQKVGESEISTFLLADAAYSPPQGFEAPPLPAYDIVKKQLRIAECVLLQITELGPRLCSADANGNCPENLPFDDSGDSITAGQDFYGVDYDRIPALEKSVRGDKVLLCLKSIPKHCPKGDDRGYFWNWTNLRTGGKWTLPDAQHTCGGA